jgi:hypothetical protein
MPQVAVALLKISFFVFEAFAGASLLLQRLVLALHVCDWRCCLVGGTLIASNRQ